MKRKHEESPGKLAGLISRIDMESTILRLIAGFVFVCTLDLCRSRYSILTFEYFLAIRFARHLLWILGVAVILTLYNRSWLDRALLVVSTFLYCAMAVRLDGNVYFVIVCGALVGIAIVFSTAHKEDIFPRIKPRTTIFILALAALLFVVFCGGLSSIRYLSHYSSCFDFGIFAQMFTYMKETLQPLVTCERDGLLSHFAVHFSPIYYLLLPFFALFPSPITLLICQACILASGLIPLYLLCKRYNLSNMITLLTGLLYVLLPSMAGGTFFFLHENKFLAPLLLWLMYFMETDRLVPIAVAALLVMMVKEDAPVYAAILALYFVLSRRNIKKGALVLGVSILYFALVTYWLSRYGDGVMLGRYSNYIYDDSGSLVTVIKAVLLNPIYVFSQSFSADKIPFFLQMLAPLGFLPLMIKKPSRLILFFPFLLINLMSNNFYQHNIGFQYTYGSAAFLFYLAILNYGELSPKFRERLLLVSVSACVLFFVSVHSHKLDYLAHYRQNIDVFDTIDKALEMIPDDASVKANTFLVPALYEHKELYELETTVHDSEYIAVDLRNAENRKYANEIFTGSHGQIFCKENIVAILKRIE